MAATQGPAPGMDFWAVLGVGQETADQQDAKAPQDKLVAAAPTKQAAPAGETETGPTPRPEQAAAAKRPASPKQPAPGKRTASTKQKADAKQTEPTGQTVSAKRGAPAGRAAPALSAPEPEPPGEWASMFASLNEPSTGEAAGMPQAPAADTPVSQTAAKAATLKAPGPEESKTPHASQKSQTWSADTAGPLTPPAADPAWITAAQIADSIRPRMVETYLELLTQYTDGDPVMARKVYDVLGGSHLLGELWRDTSIYEVHIRGTLVTVCNTYGVHDVPGFPNLTTAHRAIETARAAQKEMNVVVTDIGDSVVISRRHGTGLDAAVLVAIGAVTEEQLSQVKRAIERMRAVTVTGPAARIVVRAFASLIPAGSRVFEGPHAVLPAGCVATASPLDADYVVGVRPGLVAEEMAAAGQLGALIANPQTQFRAALQFIVSGRSTAPEKVTAH
jgi:hypothetical protein